jgi:hypothetical protein
MRDEEPRKRRTVDSFDKLGELTGSHHGNRIRGAGAPSKRQQRPRGNVPVSQAKAVFLPARGEDCLTSAPIGQVLGF